MKTCLFCENPCDENNPDTYHEVTSWVNGPKLDGPKMREQTGRVAHKHCIDNLSRGQAPDQPELFSEGEPYGQVIKLTGPDSLHTALARGRCEGLIPSDCNNPDCPEHGREEGDNEQG